MGFPGKRSDTIQNGASVSDGIDVDGYQPSSLVLTSTGTWDSTSFDIQVSVDDGSNFIDIYDVFGSKVNITVADGKHSLPADAFKDVTHVRVSGSTESGERSLEWLIKSL